MSKSTCEASFVRSFLWDRVNASGGAVQLDGSEGNGLVTFGRPPPVVEEMQRCNPLWARAVGIRPVIVSASLYVIGSDPFNLTAEFRSDRRIERAVAEFRRFPFFDSSGTAVRVLFLSNLWVPVDSENGSAYSLRFVSTGRNGSVGFSVDYQWSPYDPQRDAVIESRR